MSEYVRLRYVVHAVINSMVSKLRYAQSANESLNNL